MQGRGMLKKPPRVGDNNGALQVRLRLDACEHFINFLGRFDDPVAHARGQAICAEIWLDTRREFGPVPEPIPPTGGWEGRDQDLLEALKSLAEEMRHGFK